MPLISRDQTRNLTFRLNVDGNAWDTDRIQAAVLMDIRDELQKLNAVFHCSNFLGIPRELRLIKERLPKRRKRKTTKKGS